MLPEPARRQPEWWRIHAAWVMTTHPHTVIPAKAGIQCRLPCPMAGRHWIPAFAGMTHL